MSLWNQITEAQTLFVVLPLQTKGGINVLSITNQYLFSIKILSKPLRVFGVKESLGSV
jgi:hypothetical protein